MCPSFFLFVSRYCSFEGGAMERNLELIECRRSGLIAAYSQMAIQRDYGSICKWLLPHSGSARYWCWPRGEFVLISGNSYMLAAQSNRFIGKRTWKPYLTLLPSERVRNHTKDYLIHLYVKISNSHRKNKIQCKKRKKNSCSAVMVSCRKPNITWYMSYVSWQFCATLSTNGKNNL